MTNIKRSILNRILFSFCCVLVFAGVIIWYIVNIQVVNGSRYRSLSDSLTLKYKVIQAVRGNIYSHDGTLLATSVPRYELRMDMTVMPDDTFGTYMPVLARLFSEKYNDRPAADYLRDFKKARQERNRYYLLKKKLSFLDIKEIRTWPLLNKGRYKSGLIIEEDNYRVMPFKNLLARTIGYVSYGKTSQLVGIEGAFDKELAGTTGRRLVQKISGGYRPVNDNNELEPVDGKDIYTTIDIHLQDIVNNALQKGLTKHQAQHGCAILMDVKTGEIKALANLTASGTGNYLEDFNYAIRESFEPGSTFKLVSALALLEHKKIEPEDTVLINYGEAMINGKAMTDAELSPYKKNTFSYAFEHSSNVGISTSVLKAYGDNPETFLNYIKKIHLDQRVGIELPGEVNPFIKSPKSKSWSRLTLPWMSIGYEVKLTPLQILTVYNAVANDGVMVKPFLVKAIGTKGDIEKKFETTVLEEEIAEKNTLRQIRSMLKGVVDSGTARVLSSCLTSVSGKTGTASISAGQTGYQKGAYYSSFAGFFPSEAPRYSVIVVVCKPQTGGYFGGVVAAPVVKEIVDKVMGNTLYNENPLSDTLNSKNSFPQDLKGRKSVLTTFIDRFTTFDHTGAAGKADWVSAKRSTDAEYLMTLVNQDPGTVPDFTGLGLRDAIYLAGSRKLNVQFSGFGHVVSQSIPAGTHLTRGSSIQLKLSIQ